MLLAEDGDLRIDGNGIAVGNTLYQNQYLILKAQRGEFKEHPALGVGIGDMPNDGDFSFWKKRIREELAKDGLRVSRVELDSANNLLVDATYNE